MVSGRFLAAGNAMPVSLGAQPTFMPHHSNIFDHTFVQIQGRVPSRRCCPTSFTATRALLTYSSEVLAMWYGEGPKSSPRVEKNRTKSQTTPTLTSDEPVAVCGTTLPELSLYHAIFSKSAEYAPLVPARQAYSHRTSLGKSHRHPSGNTPRPSTYNRFVVYIKYYRKDRLPPWHCPQFAARGLIRACN